MTPKLVKLNKNTSNVPARIDGFNNGSVTSKKVRKGLAGLAAAADLPDAICSHWRAYGRILSMSGEEGLRHWYREKLFHDDSRIRQLVTDHHQFSEI